MFAREAFLVVSVCPRFYGFSIESSYFGPHLVLVIHTRLLKIAVELDRHKNFLYFLLESCDRSYHTVSL